MRKFNLNHFNFVPAKITNLTKTLPEAHGFKEKFCTCYGCSFIFHAVREAVETLRTLARHEKPSQQSGETSRRRGIDDEEPLCRMATQLRTAFPEAEFSGAYLAPDGSRAYTDDPATTSPEPYAYESSFAVKWLIEKQIQGSPDLNASPRRGEVVAPVLLWGPYLWADGTSPRSDGLVWLCGDTDRHDFTHPSPSGQQKVGSMLLEFFKDDPAARPWFIAGGGAVGND